MPNIVNTAKVFVLKKGDRFTLDGIIVPATPRNRIEEADGLPSNEYQVYSGEVRITLPAGFEWENPPQPAPPMYSITPACWSCISGMGLDADNRKCKMYGVAIQIDTVCASYEVAD